jgi:hypothetical protein
MSAKSQAARLLKARSVPELAREIFTLLTSADFSKQLWDTTNLHPNWYKREVISDKTIDTTDEEKDLLGGPFTLNVPRDSGILVCQTISFPTTASGSEVTTFLTYLKVDRTNYDGDAARIIVDRSMIGVTTTAMALIPVKAGAHAIRWIGERTSGDADLTISAGYSILNLLCFGASKIDLKGLPVPAV